MPFGLFNPIQPAHRLLIGQILIALPLNISLESHIAPNRSLLWRQSAIVPDCYWRAHTVPGTSPCFLAALTQEDSLPRPDQRRWLPAVSFALVLYRINEPQIRSSSFCSIEYLTRFLTLVSAQLTLPICSRFWLLATSSPQGQSGGRWRTPIDVFTLY